MLNQMMIINQIMITFNYLEIKSSKNIIRNLLSDHNLFLTKTVEMFINYQPLLTKKILGNNFLFCDILNEKFKLKYLQ